jgi:hypothetical protein
MSVEIFRRTHNDQPPASNAWHPMTILLLGLILWTPVLPWLFKSLGFD